MTTPPEKSRYASPEQAARIYLLPNLFTAGNMLCGFLSIKNLIEARFASGADNARPYQFRTSAGRQTGGRVVTSRRSPLTSVCGSRS